MERIKGVGYMDWKDIKNAVYSCDSDSTNPRPTTRALKELVRYLDEYFEDVDKRFAYIDKELADLRKEIVAE